MPLSIQLCKILNLRHLFLVWIPLFCNIVTRQWDKSIFSLTAYYLLWPSQIRQMEYESMTSSYIFVCVETLGVFIAVAWLDYSFGD